jgi:hypothetical protein
MVGNDSRFRPRDEPTTQMSAQLLGIADGLPAVRQRSRRRDLRQTIHSVSGYFGL